MSHSFNNFEQKVIDYVKDTGLLKLGAYSINVDQQTFNLIVFWLNQKGLVANYDRFTNGDYFIIVLDCQILDFCK